MMASGGFDPTIEKWTTSGVWAGVRPMENMTNKCICIAYDRREAGLSGSVYHDAPLADQTPEAVRQWILEFLGAHAGVTAG